MEMNEKLSAGRKAESIFTAMKKNMSEQQKKRKTYAVQHSVSSYEAHLARTAAPKACYVCVNGISMPILSA